MLTVNQFTVIEGCARSIFRMEEISKEPL